MDEFMAKMAQSVNDEYKNLHALLATLPDPSVDTGPVAIPVAEAREKGLIPKADTALLQAFSASEMKLYKHATKYKWTTDELADTIKLIKSADFKVEDINACDLHRRQLHQARNPSETNLWYIYQIHILGVYMVYPNYIRSIY
jgi:hypothetical protein